MRPQWLWLAVVLLLPACPSTTEVLIPPRDKPQAVQQRDAAECWDRAVQDSYAAECMPSLPMWRDNPVAAEASCRMGRKSRYLECMQRRGYTVAWQ
jgi:hypothetical protein